jgi:hypothetical protein
VLPGLYGRSRTNRDQQGIDDYVGVSTAAWMVGSIHVAKEILNYGKKNVWVYNNVRPGTNDDWDGSFNASAQMGRYPALICHLYWCAKETPPLWLQIYWAGSVLLASFKPRKDQDNWILSWLMIQVGRGRTWFIDLVISIHEFQRNMIFKDGMRQVFLEYFGDPEHPCARYFVD